MCSVYTALILMFPTILERANLVYRKSSKLEINIGAVIILRSLSLAKEYGTDMSRPTAESLRGGSWGTNYQGPHL